jgi:hypothetical protein
MEFDLLHEIAPDVRHRGAIFLHGFYALPACLPEGGLLHYSSGFFLESIPIKTG